MVDPTTPGPITTAYCAPWSTMAHRHGAAGKGCWLVGRRALIRHMPGWADDFRWTTLGGPYETEAQAVASAAVLRDGLEPLKARFAACGSTWAAQCGRNVQGCWILGFEDISGFVFVAGPYITEGAAYAAMPGIRRNRHAAQGQAVANG